MNARLVTSRSFAERLAARREEAERVQAARWAAYHQHARERETRAKAAAAVPKAAPPKVAKPTVKKPKAKRRPMTETEKFARLRSRVRGPGAERLFARAEAEGWPADRLALALLNALHAQERAQAREQAIDMAVHSILHAGKEDVMAGLTDDEAAAFRLLRGR